jgi:cytochrome c oxidase subunit 2
MSATTDSARSRDHRYVSFTIGMRKTMGKIREWKLTLVLAAALTAAGILGYAQSTPSASAITVTAKKYDFTPNVITVRKGDRVKLVITALDRDHGIKIESYRIDQKLPKGEPVTVEFVADQAGTFPFQCSQFCGFGHKNMKGTLVVE